MGLVASAAVVAGCGPQPPLPIMHVTPSTDVRTGQNVKFDSTPRPGDPPDQTKDDTTFEWDLNGDGRFETRGRTVIHGPAPAASRPLRSVGVEPRDLGLGELEVRRGR